MDPITLAAGGAIIGGLINWYNSDKALNASEDERNRIANLMSQLQNPNFDTSQIMPEDLAVVGKYVPEVAPYIKEVAPQTVQGASYGSQVGREAQLETLTNLRRLASQGIDPIMAIRQQQALRQASQAGASQRAGAHQEAQRRGFGGGLSFYNRGAGQDAQNAMALAGQQNAMDAAQRQQQAMGQAAALGGDIRGQDISLEQMNANIINSYNQRLAQNQQAYGQYAAGTRNQGQVRNLDEQQRIADANKQQHYQALQHNRDVGNQYAQQRFNNDLSRVTGQQQVGAQSVANANQRADYNSQTTQGIVDALSKAAIYKSMQDENQQYKKLPGYARN